MKSMNESRRWVHFALLAATIAALSGCVILQQLGMLAPDRPSGLSVGHPTTTTLAVSWNTSTGASSYQAFRSTAIDGPWVSQVYDGSGTSFTDTGLSSATTYYYAVRATNSAGSSPLSSGVRGDTTTAPTPPSIGSFTANPVSITTGSSATLTWSTTGATTVSIDQGIGNVSASGSQTVSPTSTTTYTLTATNAGGSVTASCTVTVTAPSPPSIGSFTANPVSITTGNSSTLSWSTTGATTVSIDQGIGSVSASGSQTVSPTSTTTYTLTATNAGGSVTASCTVTVTAPSPPSIGSFTANPTAITAGSSATLTWSTTGATTVSIDQGIGSVSASGSQTVSPTSTTTYTLTATNAGGTVTASCTVTIALVAEGFEGTFPGAWTVGKMGGAINVTWGANRFMAASGSWSAFCASSLSPDNNVYTDGIYTYMERPFSLYGYSSAALSFNYYVNTQQYYDYLNVFIYDASTSSYNLIMGSSGFDTMYWSSGSPKTIDISTYAGKSSLKIRFEFQNMYPSSPPPLPSGAWVDNVVITAH